MKNLFRLLAVNGFVIASFCQADAQVIPLTPALDSAIQSQTKTFATGANNGNFSIFTVQVDVTKASGALAGLVTLQGSVNGTTWVNAGADSLTLTDVASQTHIWPVGNPNKYLYYRVQVVATSATQKAYYRCVYWKKE